MNYREIMKSRRSVYALHHQLPVSDEELINTIQTIIVQSPTAFNMQSSHLLVLMDEAHHRLWEIVTNVLKNIVPEDKFSSTQRKMEMFSKAKGTILFFDDKEVTEKYKKDFPLYKDQIDTFVQHGMGILQGNIWNALAEMKIGASLQHYNPLIDEAVKAQWNLPESYSLQAQMVFGSILNIPEAKEKICAEKRVQIYYE